MRVIITANQDALGIICFFLGHYVGLLNEEGVKITLTGNRVIIGKITEEAAPSQLIVTIPLNETLNEERWIRISDIVRIQAKNVDISIQPGAVSSIKFPIGSDILSPLPPGATHLETDELPFPR